MPVEFRHFFHVVVVVVEMIAVGDLPVLGEIHGVLLTLADRVGWYGEQQDDEEYHAHVQREVEGNEHHRTVRIRVLVVIVVLVERTVEQEASGVEPRALQNGEIRSHQRGMDLFVLLDDFEHAADHGGADGENEKDVQLNLDRVSCVPVKVEEQGLGGKGQATGDDVEVFGQRELVVHEKLDHADEEKHQVHGEVLQIVRAFEERHVARVRILDEIEAADELDDDAQRRAEHHKERFHGQCRDAWTTAVHGKCRGHVVRASTLPADEVAQPGGIDPP